MLSKYILKNNQLISYSARGTMNRFFKKKWKRYLVERNEEYSRPIEQKYYDAIGSEVSASIGYFEGNELKQHIVKGILLEIDSDSRYCKIDMNGSYGYDLKVNINCIISL